MMPLTNPHSQQPQDLESPVPNESAENSVPPPQKISMPPMEIQAGREPAVASQPTTAPTADSPDIFADVPDAKHAELAPFADVPDAAPQEPSLGVKALNAIMQTPSGEVGSGVSPSAAKETEAAPQFVKLPDGQYGIMDASTKEVRHLSEGEKGAFKFISHAIEIGGPTIGAIFGGVLGGAAGGGAARIAERPFKELAGEKPPEDTILGYPIPGAGAVKDVAGGAATGAVGALVGKGIGAIAKAGLGSELPQMANVAGTAASPSVQAGENVMAQAAGQKVAASREAGIKLFPEEVNVENPTVTGKAKSIAQGYSGPEEQAAFLKTRAGRDQQVVEKVQSIRDEIGPKLSAEDAKAFSAKSALEAITKGHEKDIAELKAKSYIANGNKPDAAASMKLASGIDETLSKRGVSAPTEMKKIRAELGADGGKGVTQRRLDQIVTNADERANYDAKLGGRSQEDRLWGEVAHSAREARNDLLDRTFQSVNDKASLDQLTSKRAFYSRNIEQIRDLTQKLSEDPSLIGAVKEIAKKNNPATLGDFLSYLPDEQAAQARRLVADEIIGEPQRGSIKEWANKAKENLHEYDPKSQDLIFEKGTGELAKVLSLAKHVDALPTAAAEDSNALKEITKIALSSRHRAVKSIALKIVGAFEKLPTAAEFEGAGNYISQEAKAAPKTLKQLSPGKSAAATATGVVGTQKLKDLISP